MTEDTSIPQPHKSQKSAAKAKCSKPELPVNFFDQVATKSHRGRGYNYPVMDTNPEQFVVTKRSVFRNFKRYLRQHLVYLQALSEIPEDD